MTVDVSENPAVVVAKRTGDSAGVHVTMTGYKVRIAAFPELLMRQAILEIKNPPVPLAWNEDKERDEPNPHDPDYLQALAEAEEKRNQAGLDAALLFGVELLDPLPTDDRWLRKLSKLGIQIDAEDEIEKELAFLKYMVFTASEDLAILMRRTTVTGEGVAQAVESFRGDAQRDTD